ncbi:MAG: GDSL-type esterase/lipase family protein, partial [Lachnospiraceae bacterium]
KFLRAESKDGKVQEMEWQSTQEDAQEIIESIPDKSGQENYGEGQEQEQEYTQETSGEQAQEETQETSEEHAWEDAQEASGEETSEADRETQSQQETLPEFTQAPEGYFDDALFIGDSRTVGLSEYGGIEGADFYATTGMSVYNIDSEKVRLGDKGVISFENLITQYSYGKIYLMLGINELGYDKDETVNEYKALVERLRQAQPEAIIFVEANLHVSAKRSSQDAIYNNQNINYINDNISVLADNENIFYIDVNKLFDDEDGNLRADTTMDETHVLGRYYKQWADWLAENAIVK